MSSRIQRMQQWRALAKQFRRLMLNQAITIAEWHDALDVYLLGVPHDCRDEARHEVREALSGDYLSWQYFQMGCAILGLKCTLTEVQCAQFAITVRNGEVVLAGYSRKQF